MNKKIYQSLLSISTMLIRRNKSKITRVIVNGVDILSILKDPSTDFGFVMTRRIGDSLISMVIVENLRLAGRKVTVYGDHMHALNSWFPNTNIKPLPHNKEELSELNKHKVLLHFNKNDIIRTPVITDPILLALEDIPAHRHRLINLVTVHTEISNEIFDIATPTKSNGLIVPDKPRDLNYRRIIIHPTASKPDRIWFPEKYIKVANNLKNLGWQPEFTTRPSEIKDTSWIENEGFKRFSSESLDHLANHLASSVGFLGSDSGVAHLASCIGLPFVTLYMRRKLAIRWKPAWSYGRAIRPIYPLILKCIKERFWRQSIPVSVVTSAAIEVFGSLPLIEAK